MKIDRRLNLVVPIYADDGKTVVAWVHSTPLSAEIIDRDFLLLGQTFNSIFSDGLGAAAGPGHAMRLLRAISERQGTWENEDKTPGRGKLLVEEIRRRTNVAVPATPGGWETVPLDVAVQRGQLSGEDKSEVENVIAFFMCVSATLSRTERGAMLSSFAALWDAQLSSSTCTEWAASLKTSTQGAPSGARSPATAGQPVGADARADGKPASVPR